MKEKNRADKNQIIHRKMKINQQSVRTLIKLLRKYDFAPKSLKSSSIKNTSDLRSLIIEYIDDHFIEVWTEDWGTDDDIDHDYVELLKLFDKRSNGALNLTDFKSSSNEDSVEVAFTHNGNQEEWVFDRVGDHFSEQFLEHFIDLQKSLKDGRYVYIDGGDMPEFVYLPTEVADALLAVGISGDEENYDTPEIQKIIDTINHVRETKTKKLDLSEQGLSKIPDIIGTLTDLEELSLSDNKLEDIPESIGNLVNLKNLNLSANKISALPSSIGNLSQLLVINLGGNKIRNLPVSFKDLSSLEELNLNLNGINKLPAEICKLQRLKKLHLAANKIVTLPDEFKNLKSLRILGCHSNKFKEFPENICSLTNLEELDFALNEIIKIPEAIGNMKGLTDLYLQNNKITSLPDSIGKLVNLWRFILTDNKLESLPSSLAELPHCKRIDIERNPIHKNENYNKGTKHLLSHLSEIAKK